MTKVNWRQMILIGCFLLPLLAMAYVGHYSRYISDEYCIAHQAMTKGVWGSTLFWYNNWSGKYTTFVVLSLMGAAGTWTPPLLPPVVLLSWFGIAAWTLSQITTFLRFPRPVLTAVLGASVLLTATLTGAPSLIQSLYWPAGTVPYTVPLIFFTANLGLFIRAVHRNTPQSLSMLILSALIPLTAGGFSEVYALFQLAVFGLAGAGTVFLSPPEFRRKAVIPLTISFVSSLVSLAAIIAAPGNAARQTAHPHYITLTEVIIQTLIISFTYLVAAVGLFSPLALLTAVLLPALMFYRLQTPFALTPGRVRKLIIVSALVALALIMVCIAPPIYATPDPPPARVYVIPQFVLTVLAIFWGSLIGLSLRSKSLAPPSVSRLRRADLAVIIVLGILGPILTTWMVLSDVPDFRIFASEWDARDQAIRQAAASGERTVTVNTLSKDIAERANLDILGPDPTAPGAWVNSCAAAYYGIEALAAKPPSE